IILWIGFFISFFYLYTIRQTKPYKEWEEKEILKFIKNGAAYNLAIYGTILTIFIPLFLILLKYIRNPNIDFPFHQLWFGFIGYPAVYLIWLIRKKTLDK
ncbi:MAG: hypothetical protein Q8K37_05425, partial [Alphaproteobacteria bacterium]|nr:hypothetical protein [Alphaproteobacteria bacterium]